MHANMDTIRLINDCYGPIKHMNMATNGAAFL